jgi:biopolymer transport protein ExbD
VSSEILTGPGGLRLYPEEDSRGLPLWRRRRHVPIIRELPAFPLISSWGLVLLLSVFMIINPRAPKGVRIDLRGPSAASLEQSPWKQTIGVYVEPEGVFRVNGEGVPKQELKEKLSQELGRQAVWVVYLEADANVKFGDVVYAMGSIEDVGAKIVWITPGMRKDWDKEKSK